MSTLFFVFLPYFWFLKIWKNFRDFWKSLFFAKITFANFSFNFLLGINFRENGLKSRKSRKFLPAKVSALKVIDGLEKTWFKWHCTPIFAVHQCLKKFAELIFAVRYFWGSNRNLISRFLSQTTKFAKITSRENFVFWQNKFEEEKSITKNMSLEAYPTLNEDYKFLTCFKTRGVTKSE